MKYAGAASLQQYAAITALYYQASFLTMIPFSNAKFHATLSKGTIFVQYAAIYTVCCNCAAAMQQSAAT